MKKRALLSALALCFLAAGCDSKKTAEPPQPKTAAVVPLPPAAPQPPAASANQDAKPVQLAQAGGAAGNGRKGCTKNNCKVEIEFTGGTECAKASPDPLNIYKGNQGDDIHWKVKTNKWKFASNGIEWKDSGQQQFKVGGHENNDKKTFKWKDLNTDTKEYRYKIHLVHDDGTKCDVDPSAINGADEEAQPIVN